MTERQSQIFLYTDAALIDARTKRAMIAAGFLPIKVASLDAVKFLEPPLLPVPQAEIGEILRAALDALANSHPGNLHRDAFELFAKSLSRRLIECYDKQDGPAGAAG